MIWSVDKDMAIISANEAFEDFIEQRCGERPAPGSDILQNISDRCPLLKKWKAYYVQAFNGPFHVVDETIVNDKQYHLETHFNPITDDDGNILGVGCFSRDITLRRNHLMKIQHQNDRLKEIAWIQSHKVRSPLANIMGLTQLFDTENTDGETNRTVIDGIIEASNKLDEIIREVVMKSYDILPGTSLDQYP